ncbi:histidine ammonia-lyase [Hydrotalea sandarakina]|jgi:histidine ammonia-lyase|uniref:Histidine ammonia-lyase n=1 Tax=Hydrotalea sandarakina TaxID=1004304 RepID=A0A2W7RYT1_9BACT|nr:histidine ammonia-lyase [Hydrotalea sandarakina]PZX65661.1 histidine ammonia-lyase [Hydrotalea sandarakina]
MKLPLFTVNTDWILLSSVAATIHQAFELAVDEKSQQNVKQCRAFLNNKMQQQNALFYGINTGFGYLQNVQIDNSQIEQLQHNLLMSHACGMGNEVPDAIVKLMLLLKIKSLVYGHSGVQWVTVQRLVDLYNNNVLPVVYTQGSLGASGDLAPLSHLSLPLIGLGKVKYNNTVMPTQQALQMLNWQPVALQSKEGLALINGTQFMSAYGVYCIAKAKNLLKWANLIAAISFDAFYCTTEPLNKLIHEIRAHKGQVYCAKVLREYLADSNIAQKKKQQVQDPYSFRCIPQVHGATADTLHFVEETFTREINSVTDNPNIFPDEDAILSGGNFHGQPLALALDFLSIAMSELANISERRTYQLISGQRGLPLFLVKDPGLNSGFMIPQYTAAGIVSENKQLCTPASVDSISSSNNQEDHVSMGANAATKCYQLINNVEKVLAIELLTASQALHFRRPETSSAVIEKIVTEFGKLVPFNEKDRVLHDDMMLAVQFIQTHVLPD